MTAITRLLYPVPDVRRSPGTLLVWWERRRPAFNAIVGGTGLVTLAALQVIGLLPPHMNVDVPWQAVVVYGVLANICYSFGFLAENLLERVWGGEVVPSGPTLFRQGVIFSVGLTLLPIAVAWMGWLVGAARWVLAR